MVSELKPSILNTVSCMDIFDLCDCLRDDSIDMILCDLPYSITQNSWDVLIPFEPMWEAFKRVIKPRGAIVLTASQPFTSKLVMSNLEWFKQELIWNKSLSTGFLDANKRHLKQHENILLFSGGQTIYNPQMRRGVYRQKGGRGRATENYGKFHNTSNFNSIYYPTSLICFSGADNAAKQHPTQKPIKLFEYLIRTYTQPGDVVFDPCVGSGTTALAARNTGRNFICGDSSEEYVQVARDRLSKPYTLPMFEEQVKPELPMQAEMEL